MRNSWNTIDLAELKESIDPAQFYEQEGHEVNTSGSNFWRLAGLCPFHEDREAGSFFIHRGTGSFKCFSCDAKGGDVIAFLIQKYSLTLKEAVELLAREGERQ